MLWFSDADANTNINEIKKATIADIVDLGNETLSEVLSNGNTTGATKISVNNSSSGVDLIDDTKNKIWRYCWNSRFRNISYSWS